jgi:general secretion pathway protein C
MVSLNQLLDPDYIQWLMRKAVRKDSVASAVSFFKWAIIILTTATITAFVVETINSFLYIKKESLVFHNTLSSLNSTNIKDTNTDFDKLSPSTISKVNIFGPLTPKNAITPTAAKPVTKIPLILIGTFLQKNTDPYAIIEDDKKKVQDVFNLQDMVFGDAKLVGIYPDKVELNRNGQIEILTIDDAPDLSGGGGSDSNSVEISVDSAELDNALQNLPVLLTQARAVPYFKDGKPVGIRLFSIKSGSLYEKVGLQNGDVLKTINGNSLSDMTQAMRLFEMLKQERSLSVSLERNREEKEFKYQIR